MTGICVSLTEETTHGIIDQMVDLAGVADLFEIRGDFVLDLDLLTILRAKTRPVLYTCRAASEGGRLADDDPSRRRTLLEAVKRGYDYVDVELKSNYLDVIIEKAGNGLILSYHDLQGVPEDLDALYGTMCERGADIVKIVVTPNSIADVGRFLAFAARVTRDGRRPLIPLAMGPLGVITRIVAGRYGAPFTYASPAPGNEVAGAGQIPAASMANLYRVRNVSASTKVYGILGSNVTWSLSPILHNPAFAARCLDAVYVPLQAEALAPFVAALPALELSGFSVTRPYKVDILDHLHEVDETAALCGSVNTVVVKDGRLQGSTTDGHGILVPLKRRLEVKGRHAIVVGAGGAARSAALALARKGTRVTVLARDPDKAAFVAGAVGCESGNLASLRDHTWDILINATPVGSKEAPNETPVPAGLLRPGAVVFDMVYEPLETRLLREAQAAGCVIIDGLEMLLAQAAAQFEAWTGQPAPADVMKSAGLYVVQERQA